MRLTLENSHPMFEIRAGQPYLLHPCEESINVNVVTFNFQSEDRTLAAFVLATIVHEYPQGQEAALQGSLVSTCLVQLADPNPLLRQWLAICLGRLWTGYDKARWCGVRDNAHEKLYQLLDDTCPEVRAAAVYALGTFISSVVERSEHANNIDQSVAMNLLNTAARDMSVLVRKVTTASVPTATSNFP